MGQGSFVADIDAIRKRARTHLERGALTENYGGDIATAIQLLNEAVATEIVCMLRYKFHAITATGIASDSVKREFAEHADDMHDLLVAHEGRPMLDH